MVETQDCFAELQEREREFGISDFQISFTSLEEVFLSIARQAELEAATAEGRLVTLNLASGVSVEVSAKLTYHANFCIEMRSFESLV